MASASMQDPPDGVRNDELQDARRTLSACSPPAASATYRACVDKFAPAFDRRRRSEPKDPDDRDATPATRGLHAVCMRNRTPPPERVLSAVVAGTFTQAVSHTGACVTCLEKAAPS